MNWYLAKMIFRIICGEGTHTPQFDEQLRLIAAADAGAAYQKAFSIGQQEQDSFTNNQEKLVQWQFINISELYHLSEGTDGAEMFSRVIEIHHAETFIKEVHQKAHALKPGLYASEYN